MTLEPDKDRPTREAARPAPHGDDSRTIGLPDGTAIAYRYLPPVGHLPTILFCPGFRSTMDGLKAGRLAALAEATGFGCLRFDYRGHGRSTGRFEAMAVGDWRRDVLAVIDRVATGRVLAVGSSMGAWLAALAARDRPDRIAGLVTVAAAPDFTEELIRPRLDAPARAALAREGVVAVPSRYDDGPYPITRRLLEDGAAHRVLTGPRIAIRGPVRLIHGQADEDVPWHLSLRLADAIEAEDLRITLVREGDHRMSRPPDLDLLAATVTEAAERCGPVSARASACGADG